MHLNTKSSTLLRQDEALGGQHMAWEVSLKSDHMSLSNFSLLPYNIDETKLCCTSVN